MTAALDWSIMAISWVDYVMGRVLLNYLHSFGKTYPYSNLRFCNMTSFVIAHFCAKLYCISLVGCYFEFSQLERTVDSLQSVFGFYSFWEYSLTFPPVIIPYAVSYTHLDVYKRQGIHLLNRAKIVIDGTVLEQVSNFIYLGYSVSYSVCNDVVNKLSLIHI